MSNRVMNKVGELLGALAQRVFNVSCWQCDHARSEHKQVSRGVTCLGPCRICGPQQCRGYELRGAG